MRKRVICVHPALAPYRVDFFNELSCRGNLFLLLESRNAREQSFDQLALKSKMSCKIKSLIIGFDLGRRAIRFDVWWYLFAVRPRVVIVTEFGFSTISALLYKMLVSRSTKVYTMTDDSPNTYLSRVGMRAIFHRMTFRFADGAIFSSNKVKNLSNSHIGNRVFKQFVVPIIHNDKTFREALSRSYNKAKHIIEQRKLEGKKIILSVGRLVHEKNHNVVIKALANLNRQDYVYVVIGSGILQTELENLVEKHNLKNKVLFLGKLEGQELYPWYLIGQIFVLPSVFEPFGAVVNEALLAGQFVFCSKDAGSSELINCKNGMIINPNDVVTLSEHINKVLDLTRNLSLSTFTIRPSLMNYDFGDVKKSLEDLLND